MATKSINTRIKNRVDTLSAWLGDGVELLSGEIAVVRVPTGDTYVNPVTGAAEPVTELLMKVGDGTSSFDQLPWLSAKASDVYGWAKSADPGTISIKYNDGTSASPSWKYYTLTDFITYVVSTIKTANASLADKMKKSVSGSNTNAGVLKTASVGTDGGLVVTKSTVATNDIADSAVTTAKIKDANVTTSKIANANVTTAKIADKAVTDAKINSVSTDKVTIGTATEGSSLTVKLSTMEAAISDAADAAGHSHPYLPDTTKYAGSSTQGGAATSANKVNKSLTVKLAGGKTEGTDLFTFDGSAAKSIDITPAAIGAVPSTDIYGSDGNGGLNKTVIDHGAAIVDLQNAVTGGIHFIGTTTTVPSSTLIKVGTHNVAVGDVVLYKASTDTDYKEYICTALTTSGSTTTATWEPLGDITRIGALEAKIEALDVTTSNAVATTHKFVSQVKQTNGKVAVTYTQPNGTDVLYASGSTDTVKDKIDEALADAAEAAQLAGHSHPYLSNTTKYAGSSTQGGAATSANKVNKAVTFKNDGTGAASGTTFDGSTARTISYNTIGAAAAGHTHSDYAGDIADIKSDYVRFNSTDSKLYAPVGDDLLEIIFDCGGAAGHTAAAASYSMRMTTPAVSDGSDGVFEPDGNLEDFTGVEINGTEVPSSSYTVE